MTDRIRNLLDLKVRLVEQQRTLIEEADKRAEASPDDPVAQRMTAEENEKFDRISDDLTETLAEIRKLEAGEQLAAQEFEVRDERASQTVAAEHRNIEQSAPEQRGPSDVDMWRQLLSGEKRGATFQIPRDEEQRIQVVGTANVGGDTVPTTFVGELLRYLYEMSPIRQVARVVTTGSGEPMVWPRKTAAGTALLEGETDQIAASDFNVDQLTLNAYKYARMTYVSNELAADSGVNILSVVAQDLGESIANVTGAAYATGDGTAQPDGYVTNAASAATLAGLTPTADELITHLYSVTAPYRQNGTWLMNDATALSVRLLREDGATGGYIWQPSFQVGQPDTLLGRPLLTDHNMPTGTGNKVVVFGDMSKFIIRDVGSVNVARSDDFKFDTDLISFRVTFRTDSDISDTTGAFKSLTAV